VRFLDVGLIVVIVPHVFHRAPIAFAETFAEFSASVSFDRGVFVHLVIVGVGMTVFADVVPSSFHTLMKTLALRITVFRRRLIPAILTVILGERRVKDRLRFAGMRFQRACR
jgi:hypothetical protein